MLTRGGIGGALESGTAAENLVWLDQPLLSAVAQDLSITAPELALGIAVVVGLVTLVFGGNHDNPAQMPDKYDTARFTQYVGELQGAASTAYGPAYNGNTDPIQSMLYGEPILGYIQSWIGNNINSTDPEVKQLAQQLLPLYGDASSGANGKLAFQHDIANESVIGGAESGTYVSIWNDASQALGEIQVLDAAAPNDVVLPQGTELPPPPSDYGNLAWTPFYLPNNQIGYWAPKGDGTYYYFGPDYTLYNDSYTGQMHPADVNSDVVGSVPTYDFSIGGDQLTSPASSAYYGE